MAVLVTFCIIIFMGPHGAGIPVILMAVIGLLTFLKTFDPELFNIFVYSLLIITGFIGAFIARKRTDQPNALILSLLAILLLNAGLALIILEMSEQVNSAPIYSAIPFWTATTFALIQITRRSIRIKWPKKTYYGKNSS